MMIYGIYIYFKLLYYQVFEVLICFSVLLCCYLISLFIFTIYVYIYMCMHLLKCIVALCYFTKHISFESWICIYIYTRTFDLKQPTIYVFFFFKYNVFYIEYMFFFFNLCKIYYIVSYVCFSILYCIILFHIIPQFVLIYVILSFCLI